MRHSLDVEGEARRVETVSDAEAIVSSERAGFAELMDTVRIARQNQRWDLVDQAGERAMQEVLRSSTVSIPKVVEAARAIVLARLGRATNLGELPAAIVDAQARLSEIEAKVGPEEGGQSLGDTRYWLEELRLLHSDPTAPSYTQLCSKLRKIDRSDLGAEAAAHALELDPDSVPARTTLSAALIDIGQVHRALAHLRKAWAQEQTAYVANPYSRALLAEGQPEQAVTMAENAFELDAGEYSARTLLAAAVRAEDRDAIERAKEFILEHSRGTTDEDEESAWVGMLAAQALIDAGLLDEAETAVATLLDDPKAPTSRLSQLRYRIRHERRKAQGRLAV